MDSSTSTFELFLEAATPGPSNVAGPAATTDVLDELQVWLRNARDNIHAIRVADESIRKVEGFSFAKDFYLSSGHRSRGSDIEPDEYASRCWSTACRIFENEFFTKNGIKASDSVSHSVECFIHEALFGDSADTGRNFWNWWRDRSDEPPLEERLLLWNPSKIRQHFNQRIGDVREVSLGQLRRRVLNMLGDNHRPTAKFWFYGLFFERCYSKSGMMERKDNGHLGDFVRYISYLATGQLRDVSEIDCDLYGFSTIRENRYFDRAELLKRQKKPFPGVISLRFTADNTTEVELEPGVLAIFTSQWDYQFGQNR